MQAQFLIESQNKNNYFIDSQNKHILYCHPYLAALIQNRDKSELLKIIDTIHLTAQDIEYYKQKYNFLTSCDIRFKESSKYSMWNIVPNRIKEALANINQITFEVTESCNLNCKYCAYGDLYSQKEKRSNRNLEYDKAIILINYLKQCMDSSLNKSFGKSIYISFYGGEPLLNIKLIDDIIKFTKGIENEKYFFKYNMTTNGLLILKYIDFLIKNKIHLLVSLDGDKICNQYRVFKNGKESFDVVLNNAKFIKDKYPDYFNEYVEFNAVLHNKNSVSKIHDFFLKEFNKVGRVGEINPLGVKENKKQDFLNLFRNATESLRQSKNYDRLISERFIEASDTRKLLYFLLRYSGNFFDDYSCFIKPDPTNNIIYTGTCFPFSKKIFLTVDGKILPCERIDNDYHLGQVENNSVAIDFCSIAKKYNSLFKNISKQCLKCYGTSICHQCVFNIDNLKTIPTCFGFSNKKGFEELLQSQLDFLENKPELYNRIINEAILTH